MKTFLTLFKEVMYYLQMRTLQLITLSSHSVEDFSNLGVVVWIQDDASKEIVQSVEAIPSSTRIDTHGVKMLINGVLPAQEVATLKIDQNANNGQIEIINSLGELVFAKSIDIIGSSINVDH